MPLPKAGSNSLFSNSFYIFIIRFFPSLANLLVVIGYSRYLPQAAYGSYQHFWIQLNVLYPVACFGIHALVITYPGNFLIQLMHRLSIKHYVLYGVWVAGLSIVFALLQNNGIGLSLVVPFLFIASFSISIIVESLLIVARSYKSLTSVSLLYSLGWCIIHWYVLQLGFTLQSIFSLLLVLNMLRLAVYIIILLININGSKEPVDNKSYNIPAIRSLWIHLGMYDISQMLFSWIDKFVLSLVLTASVSAVYFNGAQNIPFLPLLLSAAGSAVLIKLAAGNKEDERKDITALMNQSGKILSCIIFPVFFYLLLYRYDIIIFLFTERYIASVPVFAASVLALPVKAYSFTTVLQRMHKGSIINAGAIADLLLACALMYPLYKWLGLQGVALSFVITTYLQALFYLYYSARLLHISILSLVPVANWILKLIVFFCLFIVIHYLGNAYFKRDIALILGGGVTILTIGISLLIEINKQNKHVVI